MRSTRAIQRSGVRSNHPKPVPIGRRKSYEVALVAKSLGITFTYSQRGARRQLTRLCSRLEPKRINSWSKEVASVFTEAHLGAWIVGRMLAGYFHEPDEADRSAAQDAWSGQQKYLDHLTSQIDAGRYDLDRWNRGDSDRLLDADGIAERLALYVARTYGTLQSSFVYSLFPYELIYWVMDPLAEHCHHEPNWPYDCPSLEAGSPYTIFTLPTEPGNCDTPCLTYCRCHLESSLGYSTSAASPLRRG